MTARPGAAGLRRSADRKVTNLVTASGGVSIKNAFGLTAGVSCPGATEVCMDVCYAFRTEQYRGAVADLVAENLRLLKKARTVDRMAELLAAMVDEFRADCARAEKRTGQPVERAFRIHWDGDFFSVDYARAWARVIASTPDVHYWVYTRSFSGRVNVLPVLAGLENITVYLSVDRANVRDAVKARKRHPWTLWAWLADTFADGRAEMPKTGTKSYACPENRGSLPLISDEGSACMRCGICPDGRGDVLFSISKR